MIVYQESITLVYRAGGLEMGLSMRDGVISETCDDGWHWKQKERDL